MFQPSNRHESVTCGAKTGSSLTDKKRRQSQRLGILTQVSLSYISKQSDFTGDLSVAMIWLEALAESDPDYVEMVDDAFVPH